jgi:hypothetical protein
MIKDGEILKIMIGKSQEYIVQKLKLTTNVLNLKEVY